MGSDEHAMPVGKHHEQEAIDKIRRLPADKLAAVENLDFLRQRREGRRLAAFAKVWDKPGDAVYDHLGVRPHLRPKGFQVPSPGRTRFSPE
jgi:hypothetical protein